MPWHAIQRVSVTANTRQGVTVPTDGRSRQSVAIGNATSDDMKIDMGDANHYVVIVAGGWHSFSWPLQKPIPASAADGTAFYVTPLASGTMLLEWT